MTPDLNVCGVSVPASFEAKGTVSTFVPCRRDRGDAWARPGPPADLKPVLRDEPVQVQSPRLPGHDGQAELVDGADGRAVVVAQERLRLLLAGPAPVHLAQDGRGGLVRTGEPADGREPGLAVEDDVPVAGGARLGGQVARGGAGEGAEGATL